MNRATLLLCLTAGVFGSGFSIAVFLAIMRLGHSAEWAAWAQAVGVLLAIVVTAWIARGQSHETLEQERRAIRARILVASRLTTLFTIRVKAFLDRWESEEIDDRTLNPILLESFKLSATRLDGFPVETLGDPTAVVYFHEALKSVAFIMTWFETTDKVLRQFPDRRADTLRHQTQFLRPLFAELENWDGSLRMLAGVPKEVHPTEHGFGVR